MTIDNIAEIIFVQLVGTAFAAVGVYAAIRADLAQLNARIKRVEEDTTRAHGRIDIVMRGDK